MSPPDFQKYPQYIKKKRRAASLALIMKICSALCANRTKNGGRRLPVIKHECYAKLSVITYLKIWVHDIVCMSWIGNWSKNHYVMICALIIDSQFGNVNYLCVTHCQWSFIFKCVAVEPYISL